MKESEFGILSDVLSDYFESDEEEGALVGEPGVGTQDSSAADGGFAWACDRLEATRQPKKPSKKLCGFLGCQVLSFNASKSCSGCKAPFMFSKSLAIDDGAYDRLKAWLRAEVDSGEIFEGFSKKGCALLHR